ncbi:MAG: Na+/H+ antiporter NhaA [Myxococcales bacterium]|nr:Na+/H+ antiporter NhaA [Myxococcales bacterium]
MFVASKPPEASHQAQLAARRLFRPLTRFLQIEAASGLLLLSAACVALIWANSPWSGSYERLWSSELTIGLGPWSASASVRFIVNDVLMAVFFFVVGLEIRREIHAGELSELRRATLPIVAALGGMIVPAVIYMVIGGGSASRGWGIPMATDIAFAVGILSLLGSRVSPSLRVLLLSVAIIDDIGAILVIAIFYTAGLDPAGLGIAVAGMAGILALQRFGVRTAAAYVAPGVVIWLGVLHAGIHPTVAGVIVGMMTPARAWFGIDGFVATSRAELDAIELATTRAGTTGHDLTERLKILRGAHREARSPVERIEAALHPWVAFAIMPVFALANAGVSLGGVDLSGSPSVAIGIVVALVVGKPMGIVLATAIAKRLRLASFPSGVTWGGIVVIGTVAGIGFTMALFIAELALPANAELLGLAKVGVLAASALAAVTALLLGRILLTREHAAGTAATADEAELSTEL